MLVPADCYRATTRQSDVPLYAAAADAQVAEAAADARAVVSMLRLYDVCLVFLSVLTFWDTPFPSHPPSVAIWV